MKLSTLLQVTWKKLSHWHDCPKWLCWYLWDDKISTIITTNFKKVSSPLENIVLEIVDDHANVKSIVWLI